LKTKRLTAEITKVMTLLHCGGIAFVISMSNRVKLPLWLAHNWLERGGRVFEPQIGLKSRALSRPAKSTGQDK